MAEGVRLLEHSRLWGGRGSFNVSLSLASSLRASELFLFFPLSCRIYCWIPDIIDFLARSQVSESVVFGVHRRAGALVRTVTKFDAFVGVELLAMAVKIITKIIRQVMSVVGRIFQLINHERHRDAPASHKSLTVFIVFVADFKLT